MYDGNIKVKLIFGEPAFDDAIEFLNKAKPMNKLEFSSIITPQLPKNEEEMKDKNDLRKKSQIWPKMELVLNHIGKIL